MLRRHVIGLGSLLLGALSFGGWSFSRQGSQPLVLSARDDADGQHYAVGYRLDGKCQFATRVAQRCHDIVQHLYATENDTTDPGRGVLGVYRFDGERLQHSGEISTHGLGPHQVSWMPDGETLVVANGGIRTEAESRVEMNLDAMEPSLVLMRRDGNLLSKETLAQQMNSVRHLAIGRDGTIVAGQQFMGDAHEHADLLAIKRPGRPFEAFPVAEEQRLAMAQYTASVAIHDDLRLVALTAPRGNRFFIWDLDSGAVRLDAPLPDCAGVGAVKNGFVVTSGQGRCRFYDCQGERIAAQPLELPSGLWDNHLHLA